METIFYLMNNQSPLTIINVEWRGRQRAKKEFRKHTFSFVERWQNKLTAIIINYHSIFLY